MNLKFINRHDEMNTLEKLHQKESSSLVLLYGRRRIGKTRLIQEFLKRFKGIYFYTPNSEEKGILLEFSRVVEEEFFLGFRFTDFTAYLNYLERKCNEGFVIIIDEFQRLANIDGAVSLLQRSWDEKLSNGKCTLILSGSSIGAMHRLALKGDAPLYGRRTAAIKLESLKFFDLMSWFPNYSPEELVEIYGSFGGTPAYLELINEKTSVGTNIIETILRRNSPLYNEPEMLLMEELRTPQRYMDILSSLAQGYNKSSEIEGSTGINRENISTYLNTLENLDLIERITSITDPKAKRGLYVIKDPFFRFWFRFVRSNKRQLELGLEENIWHNIKEDFNQHLGQVFEDICREAIINMGKKGSLPLQMDRIGRWWIKDQEIDILCLEKKNKALAIEIKWSKIDKQDSDRLITKLSTKVNQIQGLNEVKLGIIAKEIIGKEKLRNEGFFIMDLKDLKQQNTI